MNNKTLPIYIVAAVILLGGIWLIVQSGNKNDETADNFNANQSANLNANTQSQATPTPTNTPNMQDKIDIKDKFVTLDVKGYGSIKLELFDEDAPLAVENFIRLAEKGYYNGVSFHRVIPGFVVQGGDPTGTGSGGESAFGKDFADELNPNSPSYKTGYVKGTLAMANRGPNTNSSQFFITLGDMNTQLQKLYTIFGRVVSGQDVVDKIGAKGTPSGQPSEKIIIEKATVSDK
jgi:cyclophilin family peptidyl-prolyl cis-trans isomerase